MRATLVRGEAFGMAIRHLFRRFAAMPTVWNLSTNCCLSKSRWRLCASPPTQPTAKSRAAWKPRWPSMAPLRSCAWVSAVWPVNWQMSRDRRTFQSSERSGCGTHVAMPVCLPFEETPLMRLSDGR